MTSNPPIILLDTNVWLDYFIPHRPGYRTVGELLAEAEVRSASLCYPSQSILDVYYQVRSDNKKWFRQSRPLTEVDAIAIKRFAWDCVANMRRIGTAVPVDACDIDLACRFRDEHDDLEDDLVLAACQRAKANYLVTDDEGLLRHAPIEAHTPAEMLELLRLGRAHGNPPAADDDSHDWLYRWLAQYGSSADLAARSATAS